MTGKAVGEAAGHDLDEAETVIRADFRYDNDVVTQRVGRKVATRVRRVVAGLWVMGGP